MPLLAIVTTLSASSWQDLWKVLIRLREGYGGQAADFARAFCFRCAGSGWWLLRNTEAHVAGVSWGRGVFLCCLWMRSVQNGYCFKML